MHPGWDVRPRRLDPAPQILPGRSRDETLSASPPNVPLIRKNPEGRPFLPKKLLPDRKSVSHVRWFLRRKRPIDRSRRVPRCVTSDGKSRRATKLRGGIPAWRARAVIRIGPENGGGLPVRALGQEAAPTDKVEPLALNRSEFLEPAFRRPIRNAATRISTGVVRDVFRLVS